jgi:homocysteine S-methyltransferase
MTLISVQLIGTAKKMNEGFNYAGKSLSTAPQFVVRCTFNPNAKNIETQVSLLERKVAAGAQYVMTQPVFDLRILDEMAKRTKGFECADLYGSGRSAEATRNICTTRMESVGEISQAGLERFPAVT